MSSIDYSRDSKVAPVTTPPPVERDRPQGKDDVTRALKKAALALLAERGTSFSVRDVAGRANVNHGLVHRHFGSKQELITAALTERNVVLQGQLDDDLSPLDLVNPGEPTTAVLLARLILDDATDLISGPIAAQALVRRVSANLEETDVLSANERTAIASAIVLGWAVFGQYALGAAGATPGALVDEKLEVIVRDLLEPHSPNT